MSSPARCTTHRIMVQSLSRRKDVIMIARKGTGCPEDIRVIFGGLTMKGTTKISMF